MAKHLETPTGKLLVGVWQSLPATAFICEEASLIDKSKPLQEGQHEKDIYEIEYLDNSKLHWDEQEPIRRKGFRVFVDEDGKLWREDELKLVE